MDTTYERCLQKFCRTCMCEVTNVTSTITEPERHWQSIFDTVTEFGKLSIAELLSQTMPKIKVDLNDERLPTKICDECLLQLRNSFRFQVMCLRTDQQMRQLLEDSPCAVKERKVISETTFPMEETSLETRQRVRVKSEKYLLDIPSQANGAAIADPLQNCLDYSEIDNRDKYIKDEPSDDDEERNVAYDSDREIFHSTINIKYEIIEAETTDGENYNGNEGLLPSTYTESSAEQNAIVEQAKDQLESPRKSSKQYICKFCEKSCKNSVILRDHMRTHTGERPYLCPECGKDFTSASTMKQHLLRHTDLKRLECPHCPKKFRCSSDLYKHKAVHGGIKRHVCDVCGDSFGRMYQLKTHKMYHTGEKPFKCEYCEMRFVVMDHQRRHMRTHTGERPYKCKYCQRAFIQSNDMIKHLRTHLGANVYRCELCPAAYRLASELRVHFATHKNDDDETRERNIKALREEEAKLQSHLAAKRYK